MTSCRRTGSAVCNSTTSGVCAPFTSTCAAVAMTPVATSSSSDQDVYAFNAHVGNPGPGGCCVIDGCAGVTQFADRGTVSIGYQETVFHLPSNVTITTNIGVSCPVGIPTSVYGQSNIYGVNFNVDGTAPPPPPAPDWRAPYVASPGDLAISIDSANDPHRSDLHNTFTPSTWRLVDQTVTVDKVCGEQQLMQGHATASLIKNDGTPCTVTIYSQGTRVVAGQ